jgi:hypothetical protein
MLLLETDTLAELDSKGLVETSDVGVGSTETVGEIAAVLVFDADVDPLTEGLLLTDPTELLDSTGVALCVGATDGEFEIALVDDCVSNALTDTLGDCDGSDEGDTEPDSDGAGDSDCFSDGLPVDV